MRGISSSNQRSTAEVKAGSELRIATSRPVSQLGRPPFDHSAQMYGPGRTMTSRPSSPAVRMNRSRSRQPSKRGALVLAGLMEVPRDVGVDGVEPEIGEPADPVPPEVGVDAEVVQRAGEDAVRPTVAEELTIGERQDRGIRSPDAVVARRRPAGLLDCAHLIAPAVRPARQKRCRNRKAMSSGMTDRNAPTTTVPAGTTPFEARPADEPDDHRLQRRVVEHHRRQEVVVPHLDELEEEDRHERRRHDAHRHRAEHTELPRAVEPARLDELVGNRLRGEDPREVDAERTDD